MKTKFWIKSPENIEGAALSFKKDFAAKAEIRSATLRVSSLGVYVAKLNGEKVGNQVLTPGVTSYANRIQYQSYDVTEMIKRDNTLEISVGPGWAVGHYGLKLSCHSWGDAVEAVAELEIVTSDGTVSYVTTDESWDVYTTEVTYADIYRGEVVDKTAEIRYLGKAEKADKAYPLVAQIGADIVENEKLCPVKLITTPKGERVIDFGQNMTGYVSLKIKGNRGDRVVMSFGEVLDKEGNFYNANYRTATEPVIYVLSGEEDFFKPSYSFQGFRFIRLDEYPFDRVDLSGFRGVVVHSDMERTGRFVCGNERINQLYHNAIWGQKGNYLDIPTDCPQRDERLGWTGDAQVFCRTAATNYDVRAFFKKWLGDMRLEQQDDGAVSGIIPQRFNNYYTTRISAGWADACTIIPWTLYEVYGDDTFLSENFEMMKRWIGYMRSIGPEEYLWLTGYHYGDWLAMDAGEDSYVGATSNDLIASAFYAYSTQLVIKAGEVLGENVDEYRELYANVRKRFREYFMEGGMPKEEFPYTEIIPGNRKSLVDTVRKGVTQTALTLILKFGLYEPEEREGLVSKLVELINKFDNRMATGFIGTPYLLHVLSENGHNDLAYELFFCDRNPSWLFSVDRGATTIWEHWNGIKDDGSFWSTDMNSYNHYAYGSVFEWVYQTVCGVKATAAGYKSIRLAPAPDKRLGFAKCAIETVSGRVESHWYYKADSVVFEFTVPAGVTAEIVLPDGYTETVGGGSYCYAMKI